MKGNRQKIVGMSYAFRVQDIVRIYDEHARSGLSNREILRRYIWPKYRICEKTFYNIINASADPRVTERIAQAERQLTLFGKKVSVAWQVKSLMSSTSSSWLWLVLLPVRRVIQTDSFRTDRKKLNRCASLLSIRSKRSSDSS